MSGIRVMLAVAALLSASAMSLGDESVVNSKHDLSTLGPGPVRATEESEICIFCHTPHNSSPAAPLWNRENPQTHYRVYASSTTDATIGQPTGESKMCLSCHDGSIALGMVLSRENPIGMTHTAMPTGGSNLTNDLSDDHPIGLRFDRALSNRDKQLRPPELVDHRIKLGDRGELECTACHDPHNNQFGDFLRVPMREGALCTTCHQMEGWRFSAHALAQKPMPATLTFGETTPFVTIADNACNACHTPHSAPESERLLRDRSYELCIRCHDGITARDVTSSSGRRSGHRPSRWLDRHDPDEEWRSMPIHVDCVDCHNPHAAQISPGDRTSALLNFEGPLYMGSMQGVPGVTLSGAETDEARFYYEVCFKCHADTPVPIRGRVVRDRDERGNVRREFSAAAASAHPVTFAARTNVGEVPSLLPAARRSPSMNCQDCHNNSEARQLGGGGANGPHGSRFDFLLAERYDTADLTIESPQAYALCYKCHDRSSILDDESFPFHSEHILRGRSPCSACHTAHGVAGSAAEHSHLINFDLSIVRGRRQFVDLGRQAGSCTLTCHGVAHVNFTYGR